MGKFIDLTGERFDKLTVICRADDYVSPKGYHSANWKCVCDCGKETIIRGCNLKSGKSTSCGCNRVENPNRRTHGLSKTRLHKIWKSMRRRCNNKNSASYSDYGARRIKVCELWNNSFEAFYEWSINNGYAYNLSIDRVDNDLGYSPDNCRWTDAYTQANNKRDNHMLLHNGVSLTMAQWSEITGISYHKLKDRINKLGWTTERALTTQ